MASKRKSTVPCMIPSKSKHMREEIILGCLPELLPTIPEDSILSISGEESSHFSHNSSRSEGGNRRQKGGTYSCPPCRFESTDLNYFLDHMHNFHADFRTQPTFYCLNCGVSVVRFETLALHNAKAHPGLMGGLVNASLHVKRRDGLTAVEQSLFTDSGEDCRESGISLTKTPIVKMMKGKGEHKKIVVSHTVEVRKMDTGKETDPGMLTNVPELQNGALGFTGTPAMPRTPVGQMVTTTTTTVANQVFHHQHTPSLYSSPCDSNRDLPKVMIPLSSIPTYDATMDTSSFLKTSFGKFPYPTKAELCYLTVVSEFPEEQIKLWFTAQRLKQGISWSPEEIEEARRKMFNTVFQGGAPQKQPPAPRRVNHIVTHHTVTGQPAHLSPMGPNCPMAKVPHGSLKGRPVGILGSQPNLSTNPQVTRVSYTAPALPPKFPTVVRTTQVLNKNTAPTLEPDKSIGLSLDMAGSGGCVSSTSNSRSSSSSSSCSSSSSISSYSSSSNGGETVNRRPMNNSSPTNSINSLASCSTNISNNDEHCLGVTNGMQSAKRNGIPLRMEGLNGNKNKFVMNNTSKSNIAYNSYDNSSVGLHDQNQANKANDDRNNNYIHKPNNSSISSDYSGTTCNDSIHNLNHASKTPNESTSTTVITKSSSIAEEVKCTKDFPIQGMSILQQLIKEEDYIEGDKSAPELKVDPIKINLKRLKMNELDTKPGSETVPPELKSTTAEMPTPLQSSSAPWGTKTPQQVHVLRQVFSGTHWPSSQQYEELSIMTGLPKSEVVRWFSDSRYVQKNGQLKWLESYQCLPTDPEEGKGRGDGVAGVEVPRDPLTAQRQPAEQDTNKQLEGGAGLSSAQRGVWQDTYTPLLGLMGSEEAGGRSRTGESVTPGVLQDPWSERTTDDHQQPVGSHPFMEQQTEASQTRDHLRMELLEV